MSEKANMEIKVVQDIPDIGSKNGVATLTADSWGIQVEHPAGRVRLSWDTIRAAAEKLTLVTEAQIKP